MTSQIYHSNDGDAYDADDNDNGSSYKIFPDQLMSKISLKFSTKSLLKWISETFSLICLE